MRLITVCLVFTLFQYSFVAKSQEYYNPVSIRPDSVEQGTLRLNLRLQQLVQNRSDESDRLYRDSLLSVIIKTDTVFRSPANFETARLESLLPRRSFRLLSDLFWKEFLLASDKRSAISRLQVLAKHYPFEENIQGNLSLAYSMTSLTDSAVSVAKRFLAHKPDGFLPTHLAISVLEHGSGNEPEKIVNLGADSFAKWTADKLYKYPAALDSLRNALAITITHRASAVKSADQVTGRLLLDFADLTVKDKLYAPAIPFYELATVYDPALRTMIEQRKAVIAEAEKSVNDTFRWASIFYAIPLISFVLILVSWLRSKRSGTGQSNTQKPR